MNFKIDIGNRSAEFDIDNSSTHYVLEQGTFIDSSLNGIKEDAKYHLNTIDIEGTIGVTPSGGNAIYSQGTKTHIVIGSTGFIDAPSGVETVGDYAKIINNGQIKSSDEAISLYQSDHSKFVNNGAVSGMLMDYQSDKATIVLAQGSTLTSADSALFIRTLAGQTSHVINHGTVTTTADDQWGVNMEQGNDTLINRGTINGAITLGTGNDVFDDRGGTVNGDLIDGNYGDDTFILDKRIRINEFAGGGNDTIKSTISMSLSGSFILGSEIENLTLLGHKNNSATGSTLGNALTGNSGNNRLLGLGNNDVIDGGAGKDHIDGGSDTDMLTGGKGDDTFVFATGYGQDTVTDFHNGQDHFDFKEWAAIDNFADLMHHHLTVAGDGLVIQAGADTLTIEHATKGQLDASDFTFG